jgi:hypothetical protein
MWAEARAWITGRCAKATRAEATVKAIDACKASRSEATVKATAFRPWMIDQE